MIHPMIHTSSIWAPSQRASWDSHLEWNKLHNISPGYEPADVVKFIGTMTDTWGEPIFGSFNGPQWSYLHSSFRIS